MADRMKDLIQNDAEDVPLATEGQYNSVPQRFGVIKTGWRT
jgi:hypothetical protein